MTISVCIPTYNQGAYLKIAVRSAFQQSYAPSEIIVSNDCSTDNSADILAELSLEIPVLKVIHQAANLGIAKNTDYCLRAASGDFIVRLDSDDYLSPMFLEKLSSALQIYPQAGFAHAAVQEVDKEGNFLRKRNLFRKTGFHAGEDALKAAIRGYRVAANIIMFRKEVLEKVNYCFGRPNYVEDYHLTTSISALSFGNVYVNEILSYYRVWSDEGNVRQRRKLDEITGLKRVFEEVLELAYRDRGWKLNKLKKKRTDFACIHANCLGWGTYNKQEKKQLAIELRNLSSLPRARLYFWIYLNGWGGIIIFFKKISAYSKFFVKKAILPLLH